MLIKMWFMAHLSSVYVGRKILLPADFPIAIRISERGFEGRGNCQERATMKSGLKRNHFGSQDQRERGHMTLDDRNGTYSTSEAYVISLHTSLDPLFREPYSGIRATGP